MKMFSNNKKSRKALKEIRLRFLQGERLTAAQIVDDYFAPRNALHLMLAKDKARSWASKITRDFNKEGKMFGRLNQDGEYGFPDNEEEARFVAINGYKLTKGHLITSSRKIANGQRQKLILTKQTNIKYMQPLIDETPELIIEDVK